MLLSYFLCAPLICKGEKMPIDEDKGKPYAKVPVAQINSDIVVDSSAIVKEIEDYLRSAGHGKIDDIDAFFGEEAQKWHRWSDSKLAILLFPNITRNFSESYQAFSYVQDVETFSAIDKISNQIIGATAMWAAQGKIKKKYGIDDEREALQIAIDEFLHELGDKKFICGDKISFGDICVYGCLRAIRGLDTYNDIVNSSGIGTWYERVKSECPE